MVVYAGKPPKGKGPFYTEKLIHAVKALVEKLEESSQLEGKNLSFDRL